MNTLQEDYHIWIEKQKELEPILPLRYMAELAHVSLRTAQKRAQKLVKLGLAEEVSTGETRKRYRMIEQ